MHHHVSECAELMLAARHLTDKGDKSETCFTGGLVVVGARGTKHMPAARHLTDKCDKPEACCSLTDAMYSLHAFCIISSSPCLHRIAQTVLPAACPSTPPLQAPSSLYQLTISPRMA